MTDFAPPGSGRRPRVLVVVPAFNEAGSIGALVAEFSALDDVPDVLVVDDGSADDTAQRAERAGARVLRLPFNCGIGATVQAGIAWAAERGYDVIARFDGDGQHDPRTLPLLVSPVLSGEADFVVGSRYIQRHGFQSTWARRLGSRWFAFLLRILSGLRITDPTSGCWVANRAAAGVLRADYSSDYPEVDSLIRLQRARCKVREQPVVMRERSGGVSSIDALRAPYYMLKVTIALVIGRVEQRATGGAGWGDAP